MTADGARLFRERLPQVLAEAPYWENRIGTAKRNIYLGDVRDSDPSRWDYPFATPDLHTALTVLAPDRQSLENRYTFPAKR